jgi:co-chaperonin GroES (HSP10)
MKAQGDHLIVQLPRKRDTTDKGILLPDTVGKTFCYGKVLSVGPGVAALNVTVQEGEYITFDSFGGREILLDSLKDDGVVAINATQVFTTIDVKELESRKLPTL